MGYTLTEKIIYSHIKDKTLPKKNEEFYLDIDYTLTQDATGISYFSEIADAFYIGGTKNELLFGEAVVLKEGLSDYFRYQIKHKGAMLAKGFVLGIQFERLFKDDLFFEIGRHENKMAELIYEKLDKSLFTMPLETNQLFIKVKSKYKDELIEKFELELWEDLGNIVVLRIVTSFKTDESDIKELVEYINSIIK